MNGINTESEADRLIARTFDTVRELIGVVFDARRSVSEFDKAELVRRAARLNVDISFQLAQVAGAMGISLFGHRNEVRPEE